MGPVFRLVIILSGLLIIAVCIARWWFWGRVQMRGRRIECSMSVAEMYERLGVTKGKPSELRDATALGITLRDAGLHLLEADGNIIARKRRRGWWNLRVLPALILVILVFSFFNRSFSSMWVVAIGCLLIAAQVAIRVAGISVELMAVKRGWKELEKKGGFRRMDEEEAVLRCARASVWDTVLPW
ncbi:hypothetical protein [Haloferula rosea]|mgnify:CR=1 FL=1|uniref:Uncharacterized protein n=1 Tax=Haloferula rosea TaxID=490093 RepID=A0A934RCI9_9BACT|nr:hypothetical protein [Haloferula rosea]MBK1826101.1 hypothetical protein [Haloferula rosea]